MLHGESTFINTSRDAHTRTFAARKYGFLLRMSHTVYGIFSLLNFAIHNSYVLGMNLKRSKMQSWQIVRTCKRYWQHWLKRPQYSRPGIHAPDCWATVQTYPYTVLYFIFATTPLYIYKKTNIELYLLNISFVRYIIHEVLVFLALPIVKNGQKAGVVSIYSL